MASPSAQSATVTVSRVLSATPERVFACWTEPRHLANWFRPEARLTTPIAEVDLRVGGKYRIGIHDAERNTTFICHGEFRELDPPRRISYTWDWENPEMSGIDSVVTVEFRTHGEQETEVTISHVFQDAGQVGGHEQGWVGCLEQLACLLTN